MNKPIFFGVSAVLIALAACSGGSGASKSDIANTAVDFYRALSDDPPAAYTYLSEDCRAEIGYLDFVATINDFRGFIGEGELEVKGVKIIDQTHDHITADYEVVLETDGDEIPLTGQLDLQGPTRLVKEDGQWRFEDCAGYPTSDAPRTPDAQAVATPTFEPDSAAAVEADDDPSLPGEFVDLQAIYGGYWGNQDGINTARHLQQVIDYSEQGELPPAGGPHWGAGACPAEPDFAPALCGPVPWGVYRSPWPAESVVHNMEHSGVIIWYNTSDQQVTGQLEALAQENLANGKFIVLMPYSDIQSETIALTAWAWREKFAASEYSDQRVQEFIDALECHFDPEALCDDAPPLSDDSV